VVYATFSEFIEKYSVKNKKPRTTAGLFSKYMFYLNHCQKQRQNRHQLDQDVQGWA